MERDQIKHIYVQQDCIIIKFYSGELKKICRQNFYDPHDYHTKEVIKPNIWQTAKTNGWSIYWTGYKVFDQPYAISFETAYKISQPLTRTELEEFLKSQLHQLPESKLLQVAEII